MREAAGKLGFMNLVKDIYIYIYIYRYIKFLDKQTPIGHTKSDALV
jgi:hypothetical protein